MRNRIAYFGYGYMGLSCLQALVDAGLQPWKVFSHRPVVEPNSGFIYDDLKPFCETCHIPVQYLEAKETSLANDEMGQADIDLIVSVNWRGLFKPETLRIPSKGAVNLHGSRLPKYRGNAPVTWAIINGETETGATVHLIDEGMDTGDVIAQSCVAIEPEDNVKTVFDKLKATNGPLLVEALTGYLSGTITPTPQDNSQVTIGPRRNPQDGRIDWSKSAVELYNWVRAQTYPLPGAFCFLEEQKVMVWASTFKEQPDIGGIDGQIVGVTEKEVWVKCAGGMLGLTEVSMENHGANQIDKLLDEIRGHTHFQ